MSRNLLLNNTKTHANMNNTSSNININMNMSMNMSMSGVHGKNGSKADNVGRY